MAAGHSTGDERARKAAESAISSALLDVTIDGARGILFNITGIPTQPACSRSTKPPPSSRKARILKST
ncbi:MAG: hypothetical protein U0703_10930 [Anaerolineae bacterium]